MNRRDRELHRRARQRRASVRGPRGAGASRGRRHGASRSRTAFWTWGKRLGWLVFVPAGLMMLGSITFFDAQGSFLGGELRESGSGRSHVTWWVFDEAARAQHPVWTWVLGPFSEGGVAAWLALGGVLWGVVAGAGWLACLASAAASRTPGEPLSSR